MARTSADIQREIDVLLNRLSANSSDIGDWKVTKIYEARLLNNPDPYDTAALIAERQAVRDQINTLQEELKTVQSAESHNIQYE